MVFPFLVTRMASLSKRTSPKILNPAALSVPPVDTTSAITSATPRRMELSTAPSNLTIVAFKFLESRKLSKRPGYAVAIRLPARSFSVNFFSPGPAKRNVLRPKSSGRTSLAGAPESKSKSRPVIPASSSPLPT